MNSLTITLTDSRIIDGYVQAAINNGTTPEAIALEFAQAQGKSYADLFGIGIITSAALMARFTPDEYREISGAAQSDPEVAAIIGELTATPTVTLDNPRVSGGLELLVSKDLLDAARVSEIVAYQRPVIDGGVA